MRPQGVSFAPSAGNRDSVLSLGSIAHLQYYFARTGLLDGKGGRTAKEKTKNDGSKLSTNMSPKIRACPDMESGTDPGPDDLGSLQEVDRDFEEPLMLPPTVSTYSHRAHCLPPPPDLETLRQELRTTLASSKKALKEVQGQCDEGNPKNDSSGEDTNRIVSSSSSHSSGWYQIQGLHILDVVTLAIRAAKIYYTSHEDPLRLYSIKSERQIREELLGVLDLLKRMASRDFAGGVKVEELKVINRWVEGIEAFLTKEEAMEDEERKARDSWTWLEGSWDGREREREWLFLSSFMPEGDLPEWTAVGASHPAPEPFLQKLHTGLTLVHLHNALLKKSKRQFGEIKTFHLDTAKPYRCAENLRYWIKAAEIRWETKLKVNVSGVVNGKSEAWPDFDAAILQWSKAVRQELTKEWREAILRPKQTAVRLEDLGNGVDENESRIS